MRTVRTLLRIAGLLILLICVSTTLQGAVGGKVVMLSVSSGYVLWTTALISKHRFTFATSNSLCYALYIDWFVWDRSAFLLLSAYIALAIPSLLVPFVSQVDKEKGYVITAVASLCVLLVSQGLILRIPAALVALIFVASTILTVLLVKTRFIKNLGDSKL